MIFFVKKTAIPTETLKKTGWWLLGGSTPLCHVWVVSGPSSAWEGEQGPQSILRTLGRLRKLQVKMRWCCNLIFRLIWFWDERDS